MTGHARFRTLIAGIILAFVAPCLAIGAEIDIKSLPKPVTDTILARYPKAELTEARKTMEDNKEIYEVDLTDGGKDIEIAVFPDGKIDWVAVDLAIENIPKKVLASVHKKYPAAKVNHASSVYTVADGKDHLEHYAVEITTKNGKKHELDVTPKGEIESDEELKN